MLQHSFQMVIDAVPPLGEGLKIIPLGAKAPQGIIFQPLPSEWNCIYDPEPRDITYNICLYHTDGNENCKQVSQFQL